MDLNDTLTTQVRNREIRCRMRDAGITSVAELCSRMERPTAVSAVGQVLNAKVTARCLNGSWRSTALEIAQFFECPPEDLFTEQEQWGAEALASVRGTLAFSEHCRLSEASVYDDPAWAFEQSELARTTTTALGKLSHREERILRMLAGIGVHEHSHDEIGVAFGVDAIRIRQIEATALRKLKHPHRGGKLRTFLNW